ncbi:P-loop containing nucleoside triphosphate hydrolase protein [Jaminaea rosea]|uniref:P-loop containing nucleoside triphosphate hydrolase protein n=1 Tax=Jaminaea rosea TaxID=1569628 RepID=A0A316UWL3_9BASI|nr:P-loop containing nucleoside triphosphate hydrolase protein [Jaminaea rosea]PWN28313.1 P-loop containing nucleoside triphosphate hydrolase protein [Jaminaea rosea]
MLRTRSAQSLRLASRRAPVGSARLAVATAASSTNSLASLTGTATRRWLHATPTSRISMPGGGGMGMPGQQQRKPGESLAQFTQDLTKLAKDGALDPVIGRADEIRRVIQILSRRRKNNPVLLGEAGVGKTAVAEGLAQRIVRKEVPESLQAKRVMSLDLGAVMQGTGIKGEFESRVKALLEDVEQAGDVLLFVDEAHLLVKAEGSLDMANLLKPMLARGTLQLIAATTFSEWRTSLEKDAALARRFQPVNLNEPSAEEAIAILRGLRSRYETHHGVSIADSALVACVNFATRCLGSERRLPDAAIDLMDESMASLRLQQESKPERLESMERDLMTAHIELESLRHETDDFSVERRKAVEAKIAETQATYDKLNKIWQDERERLDQVVAIKKDVEDLVHRLEEAERERNFALVAQLRYGELPKLQQRQQEIEDAIRGRSQHRSELDEDEATAGVISNDRVTAEDIAVVVSRQTGIPVRNLLKGERQRLLTMEDALRSRVQGQDEAISAISEAVRLSRAQLQNDKRPLASFLMLGSTGVGKTELARALSSFLFDDESSLIQLNMSEYSEPHTISRLLGSPPGYVGYGESGELDKVRKQRHVIVLFDEVEKACRAVQMSLLQILEEGSIRSAQGQNIDFRNCIILATSNLGAEQLFKPEATDADGKVLPAAKQAVLRSVQRSLPPELINRFDDQLVFNLLRKSDLQGIVDLRLREVEQRLATQRVRIDVDDKAKAWLAERGYDKAYGARPLNRVVRREVLNPLAKGLIQGSVKAGDVVPISLDAKGEGLEIRFPHEAGVTGSEAASSSSAAAAEAGREMERDLEEDDAVEDGDWKVVDPGMAPQPSA